MKNVLRIIGVLVMLYAAAGPIGKNFIPELILPPMWQMLSYGLAGLGLTLSPNLNLTGIKEWFASLSKKTTATTLIEGKPMITTLGVGAPSIDLDVDIKRDMECLYRLAKHSKNAKILGLLKQINDELFDEYNKESTVTPTAPVS